MVKSLQKSYVCMYVCIYIHIYKHVVGLNHQQCKTIFTERFRLLPSSEFTGKKIKILTFLQVNQDNLQFLRSFNMNLNSNLRNIFMFILYFLDLPVEMLKF